MTYSIDFRRKSLEIKEKEGLTYEKTATLLGIGVASLIRWSNNLIPKKTRNKPATKIHDDELLRDVEMYPDAYLRERAERLNASKSGIHDALKRLGISHKKKTFSHPKADENKRQEFQDKINNYEKNGKPIIYLDEAGFANDMPRTHGYGPIGERCVDKHDWHSKGRINVIGALFGVCLLTVTLLIGSVNSDVFFAWVTQDLLPKLPPNSVIVMDNASFHKRLDIQQAIKEAGHILEYMPPYSPDLNPIEHKWAQAKSIRRKQRCTVDELFADYI
jgi:transposase